MSGVAPIVRRQLWAASLVALCLAIVACAPNDPMSAHPAKRAFSLDCAAGCNDPDPDSTAPGYYFPSTRDQWPACSEPDADTDEDGLSDQCEINLAAAFAPSLITLFGDDVRRETRWAARPDTAQTVVIIYMLGYWMDNGDTGSSRAACDDLLFLEPDCQGHIGDSESITLYVTFDSESHHWYLKRAALSAHTGYYVFAQTGGSASSPSNDGYTFSYPDRYLGYPLVWVSDGKHANYATAAQCDAGGTLGSDQCDLTFRDTTRVAAPYDRNVGSPSVHLIDCVPSDSLDHPYYSITKTECYWTFKRFGGWYGTQYDTDIAAYSDRLADFGFALQ